MKIELSGIIAVGTAIWFFCKRWLNEISKIAEPIIKEVEARAKDKLIDKADRKAIVMKAIALLEADGKIKLNFITRFIVSRIVDIIAKKLPDFTISTDITTLVDKADGK